MMNRSQTFRLAFGRAPKIVKWTIVATLILSFFAILSNNLFANVFGIPTLQDLFSLNAWGIHKFFIWQFISYLFVQPMAQMGSPMSFLFHLFFDAYLLWAIGSSLVQIRGAKHFIGLYFGGALFVGLIASLSLLLHSSPLPLAGATTSIYMLLIGWAFLFPEAKIMVFLMFPVRAKWLVFGLLGINLFLDFSNGNFLSFFATFSAMFYGYFYSVLVWEILSPFSRLHEIEKKLIYLKRKLFCRIKKTINIEIEPSKVYDFNTGKAVIKDHAFMDACLDKISSHGKKSLTTRERFRMWRISRKKH